MERKSLLSFFAVFAFAAIMSGLAYRLAGWGYEVLGCPLYPSPGTFMAYCGSDQYGDYEHGAYYYNLEPEAVRSLRSAKVLFLGDSRTQIGFSTDEVKRYFSARAIPYYIMGFGYDEQVDFAQKLIERYKLKPDVLIINSDPFFVHGSTIATALIAPESLQTLPSKVWSWLDYKEKQLFNTVRWKICRLHPFCLHRSIGIYRETQTGAWIWRDLWTSSEYGSLPVDPKLLVPMKLPGRDDLLSAAELLEVAGVSNACVVLTAVPNSTVDEGPYVLEVGRKLHVRTNLTKVDRLVTIDSSHLTWSSAQRWSARFLQDIDPIITNCTSHASEKSSTQPVSPIK